MEKHKRVARHQNEKEVVLHCVEDNNKKMQRQMTTRKIDVRMWSGVGLTTSIEHKRIKYFCVACIFFCLFFRRFCLPRPFLTVFFSSIFRCIISQCSISIVSCFLFAAVSVIFLLLFMTNITCTREQRIAKQCEAVDRMKKIYIFFG